MSVIARLRQEHLDAMIAHALKDAPVEACGLLAKKDDAVVVVRAMTNSEASPYRFKLDDREFMRVQREWDDADYELFGSYHSHTGSEPRPSPTDVRQMSFAMPKPFIHFLIGVSDPDNPVARVFQIDSGEYEEFEYEIIP